MNDVLKNKLNIAGALIGLLTNGFFCVWLLCQPGTQNLNTASWVMWTIMNGIVVFLSIKEGNKRPWLFIGWTVTTSITTVGMILKGASFQIGTTEIISILGVITSVYFWIKNKTANALIACAVAMFIAGIPQMVNFWYTPAISTWWLWAGNAIACALSMFGSAKWKSISNVPIVTGFCYHVGILLILNR